MALARANGEFLGAACVDIPVPTMPSQDLPFKGNMDIKRLERCFSCCLVILQAHLMAYICNARASSSGDNLQLYLLP